MGFESYKAQIEVKGDVIYDVELAFAEMELDEVVVEGDRTTVQQFVDKKVINIGSDLLATGGDATAVLSQLPEIRADENGGISLMGSQNVRVLINGKPSPLSTVELLRQIPSNQIETIEIITAPSAKYQADGMTGIVNIIIKQEIDTGWSGSVDASINTLGSTTTGANVAYGSKKMNYKLGGSYNRPVFQNGNEQTRSGTQPFSQQSDFDFSGNVISINGAIDWFANENNEVGIGVDYTDNRHTLDNRAVIRQGGQTQTQSNVSPHLHKTLNLNANFRHYFNSKDHFLEVDAQVSENSNVLEGKFFPNLSIRNSETDNDVSITNVAVDYTRKVNDHMKFEMGFLTNKEQIENMLTFFSEPGIVDEKQQFRNIQVTHAAYVLSTIKRDKLTLKIGLRGESFNRTAQFEDSQHINNQFNNLFPSFHASYQINEILVLNSGYNRRTSRPSLRQVNPITVQFWEFQIMQGNPSLNPEFSHNLNLSANLNKDKFSITPAIYYQRKEDLINRFNSVNDQGVTVYSFLNTGSSNAYSFQLNFTFDPFKKLNSSVDVNWNYEKLTLKREDMRHDFRQNYIIFFKNDIKVSEKLALTVSWNYEGPDKSFYTTYRTLHNIDMGLRYSLFDKKGHLSLRATDLFNTRQFQGIHFGDSFEQDFRFKPVSRIVYFSFNYRFGKHEMKNRDKRQRKYGSGVID